MGSAAVLHKSEQFLHFFFSSYFFFNGRLQTVDKGNSLLHINQTHTTMFNASLKYVTVASGLLASYANMAFG